MAGLTSVLSGSSPISRTSGYGGAPGFNMLNPQPRVSRPPVTSPPVSPPTAPGSSRAPSAPPSAYDLSTDPVLQQIQAMAGQSDQQANASALRQREQLLTGYGDQNLAAAVLGQNDPYVQAAANNPTSTLAQLRTQHDQQLHDLLEQLNQANLFYSGNRIVQEQRGAQDYQNQLANAAATVQNSLDTIGGNLASALASSQAQRIQGLQDAYNRALQAPLPTYEGVNAPPPVAPAPGSPQARINAAALPPGTNPETFVNPAQAASAAALGVTPQANMSLNDLNAQLAAQGQAPVSYPSMIGGPGVVQPVSVSALRNPPTPNLAALLAGSRIPAGRLYLT